MSNTAHRDCRVSSTTRRGNISRENDSNSKKDSIPPKDHVLNSTTHGRDNSIEDSTSHKPSTTHQGTSKEEGNNSTTTHNTVNEKDSTTQKDNNTTQKDNSATRTTKEGSNSATHKDSNTTQKDCKVGNKSITSVTNTNKKKTRRNIEIGPEQANGATVNTHLEENNSLKPAVEVAAAAVSPYLNPRN